MQQVNWQLACCLEFHLPARAERSHKRGVSSGMTLNLKPQQAVPELAMVCRTLTFHAVPASHRKLGETRKQTINHFYMAEFIFSMKTLGFSMTTKSSHAPLFPSFQHIFKLLGLLPFVFIMTINQVRSIFWASVFCDRNYSISRSKTTSILLAFSSLKIVNTALKKNVGWYKLKYSIPWCTLTQHALKREEIAGGGVRWEMSLEG